MSVSVTCSCGHMLEAADDQAGKTVLCPQCGLVVTVPSNGLIVRPIVLPRAPSWTAIGALAFGIISMVLWSFEPALALIAAGIGLLLGAAALVHVRRSNSRLRGYRLAVGGIAVAILSIVLVGPAVDRIKEVSASVD